MPTVALTAKLVETAKPQEGKASIELIDRKVKGLRFRVFATGSKSFSFMYRRGSDRKRRRVTLGAFPVLSLANARLAALEIAARVARGEDPAKDDKRVRAKVETFGELAARYMKRHALKHTKTAAQAQRMLNKDILPAFGDEPLGEISRLDVRYMIDAILDRGADVSANRTYELCRRIFNYGVSQGIMDVSPIASMKRPAPEKSRDRVLADDEIGRFWNNLPNTGLVWQHVIILKLCLLTGQRVGEVSGAKLSEIDLEAGEWRLPGTRTKNGEAHLIPLSGLAVALFREALEHKAADLETRINAKASDYFFDAVKKASRHGAKSFSPRSIAKGMNRKLGALEIEHATPHDLRRTAATLMAGLGIDPGHIERILNHSSGKGVAGIYNRFSYADQKRHALEALASKIEEIATGETLGGNVVQLRG